MLGFTVGWLGWAPAAGILGADVYSFSPNLCCFSSMTLLLLAVSGVPKSRLSCPDNKYSVSCSFWREVVIGRNLKLFAQVFQRILFSAKPFIAALTIPTISNFELFWGCYTAYFWLEIPSAGTYRSVFSAVLGQLPFLHFLDSRISLLSFVHCHLISHLCPWGLVPIAPALLSL